MRNLSNREIYEFIKFVMELDQDNLPYEKRLEMTKRFKQEVRRRNNQPDSSIIYVGWDGHGDSGYSKEYFDEPFTDEEKEEYREANWIHLPYYPWDCSGRLFTNCIYIFNFREPNSFGARSVVYHWMSRDV